MTERTCDGRCCAVFPLPAHVLDELQADASRYQDGPQIRDMLIPLTRRQAVARARKLGYELPWKRLKAQRYFTCRHWDETTRLCTIYEQRPRMCSGYPYGHQCDHPSCCHTGPQAEATGS